MEKRERTATNERTGRNKTVISRHFTHERERLADSTCVPAFRRFPAAVKRPSLVFPPNLDATLILSISLPLASLSALFTLFPLALSPSPRASLKNTALADTCGFDVLHMCARSASSCRCRRVEETEDDEIDSIDVENPHKVRRA